MKPLTSLALSGTLLSTGLIVGATSRGGAASAGPAGRSISVLRGKAISGAAVSIPVAGAKFTVVALTSTTCPITLRYGPTLARLEDAYAAKGVRFIFVNPESDAKDADARAAIKRLGLNGPYVKAAAWAQKLGAKTTTETFVLDAKGGVRYRGAVDDQYAIGAALPKPRHRYLADALDALLAGKKPPVATTPAPGCLLALSVPAAPAVPVYHGEVEAIVQKNCLSCHREGGPAPFALDSFASVKARAPMIKYVVEKGIMPPWYAAKGAGPWRNDRTLSDADRKSLMTWAEKETPKGNPAKATAPPKFVRGWTIGKPDAVFSIPEPLAVPAEGTMPYRIVDVPTGFTEDRWVKGIEVVPGDRRVVHHVLVFVRQPGVAKTRQERLADATEGLNGFFGGYVPGNSGLEYPAGMAKRIPKGSILRFQIHYTPNGTATTDQTKIGLVFSGTPEHEVHTTALRNLRFSIPPKADNHAVTAEIKAPWNAEILSFLPHMHVRGKAARYEIVRADGTRSTLLDVPRYDFNWQLNYVYKKPMSVKAGDQLIYTAWYDNSEKNPANPDPNRNVGWGEQTYDEMHLGYLEFIIPGQKPQ